MGLLRRALNPILIRMIPPERMLIKGPARCLTDRPTFTLTFDDGPHPEMTSRILEALHKWDLRATFFVIGQNAERHPHLMDQIVAQGHEIGNHTYSHQEPRTVSATDFLNEVRRTQKLLLRWTGEPCKLTRPPKGSLNWAKLQGLWKLDQTIVMWTLDPQDFKMNSLDEARRYAERRLPNHGDVVLLHDNHQPATEILETWGRSGIFQQMRNVTVGAWLKGRFEQKGTKVTKGGNEK